MDALLQTADTLRKQHWQHQNKLDWVPVGDFSFYDQVLDMSFLLGNVPKRAKNLSDNELDNYFRVARGRASVNESDCTCIAPNLIYFDVASVAFAMYQQFAIMHLEKWHLTNIFLMQILTLDVYQCVENPDCVL
jgi:hypothetical protein